jgi:hypothetical protein
MKKKKKKLKILTGPNRDTLIAQGFFDGRYKEKVVKDKKKTSNKFSSRKFDYRKEIGE